MHYMFVAAILAKLLTFFILYILASWQGFEHKTLKNFSKSLHAWFSKSFQAQAKHMLKFGVAQKKTLGLDTGQKKVQTGNKSEEDV